jgi:hypothetical protein
VIRADEEREEKIRASVAEIFSEVGEKPEAVEKAVADLFVNIIGDLHEERRKVRKAELEKTELLMKHNEERMKSLNEKIGDMAAARRLAFESESYGLNTMATLAKSNLKLAMAINDQGVELAEIKALENAVWNGLWFVCNYEAGARSDFNALPKEQVSAIDQQALTNWIETQEMSDEVLRMALKIGLADDAKERWGAAIKARCLVRPLKDKEETK